MKIKSILLLAALVTTLAAQAKLGSLQGAYASFNMQSLQPTDKALLDKAMAIEANNNYQLGSEGVMTLDNKSAWEGYEDRLQVIRWLDAVDIAAQELNITDPMSVYRVSNLVYEYYCKQQDMEPPVADFVLIEMITIFCEIPVSNDDDNLNLPQQDMNSIEISHSVNKTFDALRYFATCDWKVFDKNLINQENQAWYELLRAYQKFYTGCVMEGSMGPMMMGAAITNFANTREQLITTDQDIESGLYQGNDESYYETSEPVITDSQFLAEVKDYVDSEAGYARTQAERQELYKAFVDAWQKWTAARDKVLKTSLKNKHSMAQSAYRDGVNLLRKEILNDLNPFDDEETEEPFEPEGK